LSKTKQARIQFFLIVKNKEFHMLGKSFQQKKSEKNEKLNLPIKQYRGRGFGNMQKLTF